MTSYQDYIIVEQMFAKAKALGLRIGPTSGGMGFGIYIPDTNDQKTLPIYTRNFMVGSGSAEDCLRFLNGIEWYKTYVAMLGMEKKIAKAEEAYYDKLEHKRVINAVQTGKDKDIEELRREENLRI